MGEIILTVLLEVAVHARRLRFWIVGLGLLFLVGVASLRGVWDWPLATIVAVVLGVILVLGHYVDVVKPYRFKEPREK